MKKIKKNLTNKLFVAIICCASFQFSKVYAQITLDTIIYGYLGYQFKTVQIAINETKWFYADTVSNTFSLYNMDFTPFMTSIAVPEPFAFPTSAMQVLYITRTLFDCDSSNIEYAYYSANNNGKPFRILRTDGTLLFQLDSANGPFAYGAPMGGSDMIRPIVNTSGGAKLFLQKYPLLQPIYVYSLCGTLPEDIFDFALESQSFMKIFPNPSSGFMTFQISPPDNINEYELVILDNNAREMRREKVHGNNTYTINVSDYSSGTYFYSLCTKSKSYQTGKFILNH